MKEIGPITDLAVVRGVEEELFGQNYAASIAPHEVVNLRPEQVDALALRAVHPFVLALAASFFRRMDPELPWHMESTLRNVDQLEEWLDAMNERQVKVYVGSGEEAEVVEVEISQVVQPIVLRYLLLSGAYIQTEMSIKERIIIGEQMTSEEKEEEKEIVEGLYAARENILHFLYSDGVGFSVEQVAAIFGDPIFSDIAGMPMKNSKGEPINDVGDWVTSWLDDAESLGENIMVGVRRGLDEHATGNEMLMLIAESSLEGLALLTSGSGLVTGEYEDDFDQNRIHACISFRNRYLTYNFKQRWGLLLTLMRRSNYNLSSKPTSPGRDAVHASVRDLIERGRNGS